MSDLIEPTYRWLRENLPDATHLEARVVPAEHDERTLVVWASRDDGEDLKSMISERAARDIDKLRVFLIQFKRSWDRRHTT